MLLNCLLKIKEFHFSFISPSLPTPLDTLYLFLLTLTPSFSLSFLLSSSLFFFLHLFSSFSPLCFLPIWVSSKKWEQMSWLFDSETSSFTNKHFLSLFPCFIFHFLSLLSLSLTVILSMLCHVLSICLYFCVLIDCQCYVTFL